MRAVIVVGVVAWAAACFAAPPEGKTAVDTSRGDAMVAAYFRAEAAKIAADSSTQYTNVKSWEAARPVMQKQVRYMLGLDPWPERTDLHATVTGTIDGGSFTVEKLHFQPVPHLYVGANLYVPKGLTKPAPAVLYVCGHASERDKATGVSYGNKAHYQHHGAWYASHGYVCLIIDTFELGEIGGDHHVTYSAGKWWTVSRGYTPAGVEAWSGVRAIDYLQSRKEVDPGKIGVTGRSGGGGYSWWITAIDDRVTAAVPTAGITDVTNHVVDGTIEGHCDCMFMVNAYRWDYWRVAALAAPRPVLLANTDKDRIFPLDGVERLHWQVRHLYDLYKLPRNWGLNITEGPHMDTQELQVHSFVWMNRFVKKDEAKIETLAVPKFDREQLRVWHELPADAINRTIEEQFVPMAKPPEVPGDAAAWAKMRDHWMAELRDKSFRGWPPEGEAAALKQVESVEREGVKIAKYELVSQPGVTLDVWLAHRADLEKPELVVLNVLDEKGWEEFAGSMLRGEGEGFQQQKKMFTSTKWAMAYVAPRGIGPTRWSQDKKKSTHIERRFVMLGQTADGMRVWDVRRAVEGLRGLESMKGVPVWLQAEGKMAGVALYASLFEPGSVERLDLWNLPRSHMEGPMFLNVMRFMDVPGAVAMAAERSRVRIYESSPGGASGASGASGGWDYAKQVAAKLGWDANRVDVRAAPRGEN